MKGLLATEAGYCLDVQVLKSAAGWYIGTFSIECGPVSRESEEYWRTEEEAVNALSSGEWNQTYSC